MNDLKQDERNIQTKLLFKKIEKWSKREKRKDHNTSFENNSLAIRSEQLFIDCVHCVRKVERD